MTKLSETTLILAGHGSSKTTRQSRPAYMQAEQLRATGLFGAVTTAFFKEAPYLNEVLETVTTPRSVIVPLLICKGFISQTVIPREMGLSGPITTVGDQMIFQADPVGEHPALVRLIAQRIHDHCQNQQINLRDLSVFLVAHGNPKANRPASRHHAQQMALKVAQHCPVGALLPCFIEEAPFLSDWQSRVRTPHVLVIPLMMAAGTHSTLDIPEMIGLTQSEAEQKALHENGHPQGPYTVEGRQIWLTQAIGSHPDMSMVIQSLAMDTLARYCPKD